MKALQGATTLADSGRYADAKALLLSERARVADWPEDLYGFSALRLLARCSRVEHDFDAAREAIRRAMAIARSMGQLQLEAVALEGAALIEREDDHIHQAGSYFSASAALEGRLGNLAGRAAALSNYANMLSNRDIEGAEPLLREALRDVGPGDECYLPIVDNLAVELNRQGRYSEAGEYSRAAVSGFLAAGLRYDAYLALRTLAHGLGGAGRIDESADAFVQAHDLIRDLRRAEVDDQRYARYGERVRQIEAGSKDAVRNSPVLDKPEFKEIVQRNAGIDPLDFLVGMHVQLANKDQQEGMRLLEAGQYATAIESLLEARRSWQEIRALHMLVTVDYHLALALTEIGDTEKAFPLLFRSRALAHDLGDAWREGMALSLLGRIGKMVGGRDALDYLLEAQALEPCTRRQIGFPEDVPTDGGVLTAQLAISCSEEKAYDLAVTYYEEALRIIRDGPFAGSHRRAIRLANFYDALRQAGREDRAAQVLDELKAVAADLPDDPRVARALAKATSRAVFHSGARTQEVLDGLLAGCRAYEEARGQARGLDLAGFAEAMDPPYYEAAQVALALGDVTLALNVLERGTARTLVDVIHAGAPAGPEDWNVVPDIGEDIGISLFPTGETITLLALDGDGGAITQATIEDANPPLWRSLLAFTDSADSERQGPDSASALDAVLEHVTFGRLAEAIAGLASPGRRTWLVPHGYLHNAPLQLLPAPAARYAIMPNMTVAASLPVQRPSAEQSGIIVFGDSLGDLPFARTEARLIAGRRSAPAIGDECTLDRLRSAVSGPAGIAHIACHGRFDRSRPDRSGLLLAAAPDEQLAGTSAARLLVLPEVAQLPLDGKVVVLSACSSGMESVRASEPTGLVTALLEAGASAVIAAQWFINDLSAMLLMTRFYEHLARQPDADGLLATLDSAAADVRDMTAADLIEHGFEIADTLLALDATATEASRIAGRCLSYAFTVVGDQDSAKLANRMATADATEAGSNGDCLAALRGLRPPPGLGADEHPFAHPRHWGPFKIVGRVAGRGPVEMTGG